MKLTEIFGDRLGIESVAADDPATFFDEVACRLVASGALPGEDQASLCHAFLEREKQGSTAIGFGVAIPHVFHPSLRRIHVIVARAVTGIGFGAIDGQPTSTFICVAGPETERDTYLKLLGRLARTLRDRDWRRFIQNAAGPEAIFDLLVEASPD